jgi:hypothetical protein
MWEGFWMASPNDTPLTSTTAHDYYRAAIALAKALPRCMDDPEIVDALAFSISFFRYALAAEVEDKDTADNYDVEIVRTMTSSLKHG